MNSFPTARRVLGGKEGVPGGLEKKSTPPRFPALRSIRFCGGANQGRGIFTAGEDGNTFLPKREILKAALTPAVVFPEPGSGPPRRNRIPPMGRKFHPGHGNTLSKLHRIFEELFRSDGAENGGRRFRAWGTLPSACPRYFHSHSINPEFHP